MPAPPAVTRREERQPDGGLAAVWEFTPEREPLEALLRDLFENHYRDIVFGPCIQGAVFECRTGHPPRRVGYLDGYLTVDFGDWHLHLCIGEHKGDGRRPCPPGLAAWRRCGRAALVRTFSDPPIAGHAPLSYSLGLWNGRGEQMITFFLPNPCLTDDLRPARSPDWSKLRLWNRIRAYHLGLDEDPGPFEGWK
ncbi:MAG: hypothetical protein HYZ11_07035 [Candidatus Tectomicrobia bacterium]|uniref:Uncharacterized protein n=1 Tax=Tectimicrobiota bacterium TaxID=2528274 RepID=A0A932HY04_UNCTE|nr:hypothetical protein [Candidatus Tectomicrobia bacterium]